MSIIRAEFKRETTACDIECVGNFDEGAVCLSIRFFIQMRRSVLHLDQIGLYGSYLVPVIGLRFLLKRSLYNKNLDISSAFQLYFENPKQCGQS